MQLDDYVTQVQTQLAAAAALGDDRTRQVAEALATTAGPSVRLAVMAALTAAADEITAALLDSPGAPGVSVRMDGDDVRVEVSTAQAQPSAPPLDEPAGEATARISLRLSEALKSDIETAAGRSGLSVNTWLIRAAGAALSAPRPGSPAWGEQPSRGGHRVTGWING